MDSCESELLAVEASQPILWIIRFRVFCGSCIFYLWIRWYVNRTFPMDKCVVPNLRAKHAYRCRRWGVSLLHALVATLLGLSLYVTARWELTPCDVLLHSCGYFLADLIGDFSWPYVPHHIVPLLVTEYLLRFHESPCHTHAGLMRFALFTGWMEAGNLFAHGGALWPTLCGYDGKKESESRSTIWAVRVVAFIASRLVAFPIAWYSWDTDFPRSPAAMGWDRTLFLASFCILVASNVYWSVMLIRKGTSATFQL